MFSRRRQLLPMIDRGPLRVVFALTSMPVGGAETLLANIVRRIDRERFTPEIVCLKKPDELGEKLAQEIPLHSGFLHSKWDFRVLSRLTKLFHQRRVDAVVTVGGGDKMFWGRLAGWRADVPVVLSALHSTGWPDGVTRMNRWLTPITDGFIAVAAEHGRFLIEREKFPDSKVFVIPNGVDVERFQPCPEYRALVRGELGLAQDAPVCGIVAALRPEKNHALFIEAAAQVRRKLPRAQFVIVGDGPERAKIEAATAAADLKDCVHFLGTRADIHRVLATFDLFALTSHNEANPVSILEAMSVGLPVVATRVGSIAESVREGETGSLAEPGNAEQLANHWFEILSDRERGVRMGRAGRDRVVANSSLQRMVVGYQDLIAGTYERKSAARRGCQLTASRDTIRECAKRSK